MLVVARGDGLVLGLEPSRDRLVEARVDLVGVREVDRRARTGLRPRRDRRHGARVHQQEPGAGGLRGSGPDPRDRRNVEVGHRLCERDPVLVDRARRVDLEDDHGAVGLGLRQPVLQVREQRPVDRALHSENDHRRARGLCPGGARPQREQREGAQEQGQATHRPIVPAGDQGYPGRNPMAGASHTPRTDLRPFTDRPAFKPFAVLLIVPIVLLASGLLAIILAPPFAGAAFGAHRIQVKLDRLGADFTRIPKFPERSTIYASDGTTVLATVYLDNRELVRLKKIAPIAREAVLAAEDSGFYEHGALNWSSLVRALVRELPGRRGRAGRLDDHDAAREEHDRRQRRPDVRAQVPGARPRAPRRGEVLEGRDLRDVPERDLHGERDLRLRHGGRLLLRQAARRAHPAGRRRCSPG